MANKRLFESTPGRRLPRTDARNSSNVPAYALEPEHALAQYAATGCLNGTFYATDVEQLDAVLALCGRCTPEFVAKTAIYARERAHMKDMPALLLAALSVSSPAHFTVAFDRVITDAKMLRNFVQIMRSGVVARKSLGSLPKRMILRWLESRSDEALFRGAIGRSPSLADVIRMVHPKPKSAARSALYGYLLGKPHDAALLPQVVRDFEAFMRRETTEVPKVPFQRLTALDLPPWAWKEIARNASWQETRQSLNTYLRHGALEDPALVRRIAGRLADSDRIATSRVLPYQLLIAAWSAHRDLPRPIRKALHDALELSIANVPTIDGDVVVCPDVSGSMTWAAVTGHRKGSTSAVRCIDIAALVTAAVLRKNPTARVLPFESKVVDVDLNPKMPVMMNAQKLASIGGGGTNLSAPLARLNQEQAKGDLVIFVSDNESWVDAGRRYGSTETMKEWAKFQARNPRAKLVCLDIQPNSTTQAQERNDILNIGGF
ncbi:MAG: RNA-binding protein, partial [Planctomycetes bacterium]|nr:RNA-binding protein [Planctomycetota bacterium]